MGKYDRNRVETPLLLTSASSFSYTEAYKMLRTNLSFASISKQYKKIIVTSAIPNEGKSTIAANLAITLAESGTRVLLIDCDLRNPTLRRLLRIRPEHKKGLTTLLAGQASAEDCIINHQDTGCDVLLAGVMPPNPVELLSSPKMEALLNQLGEVYDYIICDAPPVGIVTDAAALSRFCDGVILVVRQKTSTREQVHGAKQSLDAVQANIIGTVLSCYDVGGDPYAGNSYYYGQYHYGPSGKNTKRRKFF